MTFKTVESVFRSQKEANEKLVKMTITNDVTVTIDGQTYRPTSVESEFNPFECPTFTIRVDADMFSRVDTAKVNSHKHNLEIKDVIFNPPATIIMWSDGTKTVVKTRGEAYDPEKGLAMAYLKKALGNKGNYFNQVKKWTQPYWDREKEIHEWAMRVIYGAAANMFRENEEAMAKKEEADA